MLKMCKYFFLASELILGWCCIAKRNVYFTCGLSIVSTLCAAQVYLESNITAVFSTQQWFIRKTSVVIFPILTLVPVTLILISNFTIYCYIIICKCVI